LRPQETDLATNVDSDLAVQAYIESLLFESELAFDTANVAAENTSDDKTTDPVSDIPPEPLPEPTSIRSSGTTQVPVDVSMASAEVDALSEIDFDNDSVAAEAAKNNPFLKQLEAAQRRGRAKMGASAGGIKVDNRPAWGRESFRCLAFNVSGLKLAVPVQFIDGMQPLDLISIAPSLDESVPSNALILGQMKIDRGKDAQPFCSVLDTARLVMPERYDSSMKESYRYILTLKNCDWSIAVDSIGGEIGLSPQNVRWRSEHTRREWLAGTVVDKMCALIDIDLLNRQMLADAILMESDA